MVDLTLLLLSLLGVNSFLLLWFYSPLKTTLAKILFKQNITQQEQFEDLIFLKFKSEKLSILSSCYICMSFWSSLIAGIILTVFCGQPLYTPAVTFIVFPSLCFLFKKIIDF